MRSRRRSSCAARKSSGFTTTPFRRFKLIPKRQWRNSRLRGRGCASCSRGRATIFRFLTQRRQGAEAQAKSERRDAKKRRGTQRKQNHGKTLTAALAKEFLL